MKRTFIHPNEKFWTIQTDGTQLTTTYAGIYNEPKESKKNLDDPQKCTQEAAKLINQKIKDGYEELLLDIPGIPIYLLFKVVNAQKNNPLELNIEAPHQDSASVASSNKLLEEVFKCSSLEKLHLHRFKEIPANISNLQNLTELEIGSSQLHELPESIGQLSKLKKLEIKDTQIKSLPESIGNLTGLTYLSIWGNYQLLAIPSSFSNLVNLKTLWLVHNRASYAAIKPPILQLPDGLFSKMSVMEDIHMSSNELETLPAGMEGLVNCTRLEIERNNLTEIPLMITELKNLKSLDLEDNQIEEVPKEMVNLENLRRLKLEHNPIKNIPAEVLIGGWPSIKAFFLHGPEKKKPAKEYSYDDLPANRLEIIMKYADRLKRFTNNTGIYSEEHTKNFENLMKFLKGDSQQMPLYVSDKDYFKLDNICQVLSPWKEWTFIDHRILDFLTGLQWSVNGDQNGFNEQFFSWVTKQLQENDHPGFFAAVMQQLSERGLQEKELAVQAIKKITNQFGNYYIEKVTIGTSMDTYMASQPEEFFMEVFKTLENYWAPRFYSVAILLQHDPGRLHKNIAFFAAMKQTKNSNARHVRESVLEILCTHQPVLYEPLILEQLNNTNCAGCRAEIARILKQCYGEKYHAQALQLCIDTLNIISTKKNEDHKYSFRWSGHQEHTDGSPAYIAFMASTFGAEVKAPLLSYVKNTKVLNEKNIATALKHYGQEAMDIAVEGLDMVINGNEMAEFFRQFFPLLRPFDFSAHYNKVWEIATSEYREVAITACMALGQQPASGVLHKATELLASKNANDRFAGITVLGLNGTPEALQHLQPLLEKEKSEELRDEIVKYYYKHPADISIAEAKQRVEATVKRGKLNKQISKWLDVKSLPDLHWTDGTALNEQEINFLLYRQSRLKDIGTEPEAAAVYPLIDKTKSGPFAEALLKLTLKNGGAKAPNRFALSVSALLGGEAILPLLYQTATKDRSENACAALGCQGSVAAAFELEKIMQFFKTKYPNMKGAASDAFELIAARQQLSIFELKDKIIPDFGFVNKELQLKNGNNSLLLRIDPSLKLVVQDQQGAIKSSIPAGASEQVKKQFKTLNTGIRDAAKQLFINLENYLCTQRRWAVNEWKKFFLTHPLANAAARNFIWAIYKGSQLQECFLLQADDCFTGYNKQTLTAEDSCQIGLVHPIDLSTEQITGWQQAVEKAKLTPPFDQLNRQVYLAGTDVQGKKFSWEYENKKISADTFRRRAEKMGWQRGSVVDGGGVSSYRKKYFQEKMEVFIMTENMSVSSYDFSEEVKFGQLFFTELDAITIGSYTYDEPRNESDTRLIAMDQVPPIVYSETRRDMELIFKAQDSESN